MSSRPLTLLLDSEAFSRLEQQSRRVGRTPTELAQVLLEEGLRMQGHPGIVFRDGPAGRRPGLVAGPDIWEVARVFKARGTGDSAIQDTAELTGLTSDQVQAARRYYADYSTEIDDWIRRVDGLAAAEESAWEKTQGLTGR